MTNIVKGVIFDCDGVLIDSMKFWNNVSFKYLKQNNITNIPDDTLKKISTMYIKQVAEYFAKNLFKNKSVEDIYKELLDMIEEQYKFHFQTKKGVIETIQNYKENDIKMCVASASQKNIIIECLKRLNIYDYFEFIITTEEVGKGKNFPDIYIQATEKLNLKKNEIVVFEDTLYSIETVKKAGFFVVAIFDTESLKDKKQIKKTANIYLKKIKPIYF